jgi:hypothetical protein
MNRVAKHHQRLFELFFGFEWLVGDLAEFVGCEVPVTGLLLEIPVPLQLRATTLSVRSIYGWFQFVSIQVRNFLHLPVNVLYIFGWNSLEHSILANIESHSRDWTMLQFLKELDKG